MSEIDIILYEKIKWHQCFSRYYSAQHCLLISLPFKRYGALKNLKIVLSNKGCIQVRKKYTNYLISMFYYLKWLHFILT